MYKFLRALFSFTVILLTMLGSQSARAAYDGLGKGSVPEEIIRQFSAKDIDANLRRKLEFLLSIRSPGLGLPLNDGSSMICTWALGELAQIYEIDRISGNRKTVTLEQQPASLVDLSHNERYIIYSIDPNGEENPGIFLIDRTTGEKRTVFSEKGVQSHYGGSTKDFKTIFFRANHASDQRRFTLYRYDLETGEKTPLFDKSDLWEIADIDVAEKNLIVRSYISNQVTEHFLFDLTTLELTPLLGVGERHFDSVLFGRDPETFLVATNRFGEFKRLYTWSGGSFEPALTENSSYEIEGIKWDSHHSKLIVSINDKGYSRFLALDGRTLKPLNIPDLSGFDQVNAGSFSANGKFLSLGTLNHQSPGSRFLLNWENMELLPWYRPDLSKIDQSKTTRDTLEYYEARDGTKIPMFVRRPLDWKEKDYPVLVHFHGGPEGQSIPGFSILIQALVDEGFIVVQPNVRGSSGYGKSWIDADTGPKRLNVITDIEDISHHIKKAWGTKSKIGVFGGSYGGYSTLMAMTRFAGAYDAGVSIVGMADLRTFLKNTGAYRRTAREEKYGFLGKDDEALRLLSPLTYIDQLRSPLMIIQGVNDPRVPVGEALQMYEESKAKGIPTELILFGDEGHGSQKTSNKILEIGNLIRFFKDHLK